MKKIYSIKCNKYGKFNDLKKSYIFNETLVLFLNSDKCNKNIQRRRINQDIKNCWLNYKI